MKAVLLLLFWLVYAAAGNENLYEAYYGEEFISFVEQINNNDDKSLKWQIFRNLDSANSSDICIQDLKSYRNSIFSHEKWATGFLDSSGSSGTGLLSGNTICLGDFKQCLSSSSRNFSSAYCLVNVQISKSETRNTPWVPHNVPIVFSICVPSSCQSPHLKLLLEPITFLNNASVAVECQNQRPGFTFVDCLVISFYILIWIMIIASSIPKKWMPINHDGLLPLWESLNIQRNLSALLKTNDRVNLLSSLHGLRVLSQCIVVWYHIILCEMSINYPALNKFHFHKWIPSLLAGSAMSSASAFDAIAPSSKPIGNIGILALKMVVSHRKCSPKTTQMQPAMTFFSSWKGAIETQFVLAVDTYLVIGGILLTWNCLEKRKNVNLIEYYAHRYLRLTPPYLAMILVISTFANKLCDGPLCHYLIDKEKESCDNYWWSNILYVNNIYPGLMKSCMPHSWYLAADWQLFFFVSPFVVLVINKWPRYLLKFVTTIFFTSVILSFMISKLHQLPTENLMYSSYDEAEQYYNMLYTAPYARAGPWAIGMFFGAVLHNFKNNPVKLSKNLRLLAWLLTIIGICLSVELDLPFLKQEEAASSRGIWSALFNATYRNIWAVCVCWIVFSSGTQKAGLLGNLLCCSGFQPLAKLSYSAYLIHKLIISLYFGETYGYNYISTKTQITLILGIIFLTYIAALPLYLFFEAPIAHLEKLIFRKGTTSSTSQTGTGMKENSLGQDNGARKVNDGQVIETMSENQISKAT